MDNVIVYTEQTQGHSEMDRRGFFGSLGAVVCGSFLFPRKTESAQSGGLSHEEMAQLILSHPKNVCLEGKGDNLGITRCYQFEEWRIAGNSIGSDCTWGKPILIRRIRSVVGSSWFEYPTGQVRVAVELIMRIGMRSRILY